MSWAAGHIVRLRAGEDVSFRLRGNSMVGRIESGQLCTVTPVDDHTVMRTSDIVLCKVHGAEYLHLIKAINDGRFLIGNNHEGTNDWIGANSIYGRCIRVEA